MQVISTTPISFNLHRLGFPWIARVLETSRSVGEGPVSGGHGRREITRAMRGICRSFVSHSTNAQAVNHFVLATQYSGRNTFSDFMSKSGWPHLNVVADMIREARQTEKVDVLDVGCNGGQLIEALTRGGIPVKKYTGIDFSQDAILDGQNSLKGIGAETDITLIHGDALDKDSYTQALGQFDTITCLGLTEYFSPVQIERQLLPCLKSKLSPNGFIYISHRTTVSGDKPFRDFSYFLNSEAGTNFLYTPITTPRQYSYPREEFEKLATRAGLTHLAQYRRNIPHGYKDQKGYPAYDIVCLKKNSE